MTKSKGFNSRTRRLLKRKPRESGIRPPNYLLIDYEVGQRVNVILDSRFASG
ncbi:MAG: 50S ribosomal protein L21e, partial [Candidatus Heimdallarchaeota archaeon]|nr:50S ribosomal protein L21e [Candidatus Heimdallarchaeota archaeon]MCK5049409.1 50S ribosomal protein L21e [Candidatus Heimdallarchaeota archaeon]